MELEVSINGVIASREIAPQETLLTVLRREGYSSVKAGCESGECGACTVLVDGQPRPSCVMLAGQAGGCSITTVEQLQNGQNLHPLQKAFLDLDAVQCGFCIPAMLLSASALLKKNSNPSETEVRQALSGHLCRCNDYEKPVQAVLRAAAILRQEEPISILPSIIQNNANLDNDLKTVFQTANSMSPNNKTEYQVVGHSLPDREAARLVTGKPVFTGDSIPRQTLHARVLTSPYAHAVIKHINTNGARMLPGVHAIITHKEIFRIPYSGVEHSPLDKTIRDRFSLDERVRYVGDRVAVVAAESPEIAEQALALIHVEYEELQPVLDPLQALSPKAARIHPENDALGILDASRNVAARLHCERGNLDEGFAQAEIIVEGEYLIPLTQVASLEPHTVLTYFDENENLIVQSNTQALHHLRRTLAQLLRLPPGRIRLQKMASGAGNGSKQELILEDLCALLTLATNKPVLLAATRSQEFSNRAQPQYVIRLKSGLNRDGSLLATQMHVLTSTGAYASHPLLNTSSTATNALALYPSPHMRYTADILYTNHPPAGAFRGYGVMAENFAMESHMDEIARKLHLDPLLLRQRNWIKEGETYPLTPYPTKKRGEEDGRITSSGLDACVKIVGEKLQWYSKRGRMNNSSVRSGVGLAVSLFGNPQIGTSHSGAILKLNEDGAFDLFVGANESVPGATTILSQVAAEMLAVSVDEIRIHNKELDHAPFEHGAGGSSSLYASTGAVYRAAEQMRRQLLSIAGRMLNQLPETLKLQDKSAISPDGQSVSLQQLAEYAFFQEFRHLMVTSTWKGSQAPVTFAVQGIEVEVDMETGALNILQAITAVDVGFAINPQMVENQIRAHALQSLSLSLHEELRYDAKGQLLTQSFLDYPLANALDFPSMQTFLVQTQDLTAPFGSKAIPEIALNGMPAALANAIADAVGVRMVQLPLTPENVLHDILTQKKR